uniref:Uncharacterized protein n=1 Tax=Panagrolaimus sp. ES5 TaxID=591445 RepID=A0AC34GQH8_9BILA
MSLTKKFDHLFKILMIGDSGVGKTCILNQFTDATFNQPFISTIGIDFKIKTIEINGKKIKLQIWDTAGQERFQTITTSYYRGAMGVMLVYDVTNPASFENVSKWIGNIDEYAGEDVVRMLVANKCDMNDRRAISRERGEKLAIDNGVIFTETSAKTNINIDKVFYDMAETILKNVPHKPKHNTIRPDQQDVIKSKCC